jgi:hypothetical protein
MPLLKVNQIASYSGNTLTVGTTGDTVTLATGASVSGFGFDGVVWTSNIVTSALTVSANVGYFVNTSSAAITITLPASASNGDQLVFVDYNRKFATNNLTLNPNSLKFQGNTSPNPVYSTDGQTVQLVYADSIQGWIPISDDDVTLETPQTYSADFLIIGGGASGGTANGTADAAGGGGAGGYRTSTQSITPGTVITVTVGDGGALISGLNTNGNSGSNSSISGSGLSTITSAGGGGGGGGTPVNGNSGGSGGGARGGGLSVAGAAGNTPSTSPSQGNNGGASPASGPDNGGGGGGGAGAVGGTAIGSPTTSGAGGAGTASSITGSSVTRAGGGGGCGSNSGSPIASGASGGTGGGGAGSTTSGNGTAGTANTGSGGGAANGGTSGAGGKGVVIISVPTVSYSGTSTGSPTITTSGSNTILQFNGSGSYTA